MTDLVARTLVGVHQWLRSHRALHARLVRLVNRTVGEKRVHSAILDATRPGDCVWDVGSNVGDYTRRFLERVGSSGRVVAVEPVPANAAAVARLGSDPQLRVIEAALADADGEMPLAISGEAGETSRIGDAPGAITVRVARGDTLLGEGVPAPDVLKVDVEGYEGDVLDGMPAALRSARAVVVEVHFAALIDRGRPREPLRILELLRGQGLSPRWLDSSHLLATR